MNLRITTLLTSLLITVSGSALAQGYPNKPIKAIVPFAAGSATDQIGRAFAQKMSESLGQPIIIENKAGVNGMLGADADANARHRSLELAVQFRRRIEHGRIGQLERRAHQAISSFWK